MVPTYKNAWCNCLLSLVVELSLQLLTPITVSYFTQVKASCTLIDFKEPKLRETTVLAALFCKNQNFVLLYEVFKHLSRSFTQLDVDVC